MELGSGIPEGAAKGITGSQGLVRQAALGMATATAVTLAAPEFAVPDAPPSPAFSVPEVPAAYRPHNGGAGSSIVIHFSPTIHVQAADASGVAQVLDKGLNTAKDDLRREVVRIVRDEQVRAQRRDYGSIGD